MLLFYSLKIGNIHYYSNDCVTVVIGKKDHSFQDHIPLTVSFIKPSITGFSSFMLDMILFVPPPPTPLKMSSFVKSTLSRKTCIFFFFTELSFSLSVRTACSFFGKMDRPCAPLPVWLSGRRARMVCSKMEHHSCFKKKKNDSEHSFSHSKSGLAKLYPTCVQH